MHTVCMKRLHVCNIRNLLPLEAEATPDPLLAPSSNTSTLALGDAQPHTRGARGSLASTMLDDMTLGRRSSVGGVPSEVAVPSKCVHVMRKYGY